MSCMTTVPGVGEGKACRGVAAAMKREVMSYLTQDCGQMKPSRSTFFNRAPRAGARRHPEMGEQGCQVLMHFSRLGTKPE